VQIDDDAGELHEFEIAGLHGHAAHRDQYFLVGFHIARIEVQVSHGHPRVVERKWLRAGASGRQARREPECCNQSSHGIPLV